MNIKCRVIFNKLENCAFSWFYCRNISRCTDYERQKLWYLISVYVPYIGVCTLYRCMYLIFSHRRFKGRSTAVSRNRGHVTARISNITQATKHCFKYIYTYSKYTQYMRVTTPKYTTAIAGILLHHNIVPQLLVYYCSS